MKKISLKSKLSKRYTQMRKHCNTGVHKEQQQMSDGIYASTQTAFCSYASNKRVRFSNPTELMGRLVGDQLQFRRAR